VLSELDTSKKIPLVSTLTLKNEAFNHFIELQGNVNTRDMLVLYPQFAGTLHHITVKEGQYVKKGQILAKIDDGGLTQQLNQLKIQKNLAQTTYERQERLWKQNIGSEIQYLQAKSLYEAQAQAIEQLEKQIERTMVTAPFSGTIDEVITEQGNVVGAGQTPILRIVNLSEMYIKTDVPERFLTNVVKGSKVDVNFPVLGETVKSSVRQTGSFINPANRTFNAEIDVPKTKSKVKPNLTAQLKINDYTNKEAILIPQNIISENAKGTQTLYVIENKKDNKATAKQIIIETGKTQGDVIEVLSGLKNNDEIIKEGARSVRDGQTVEVINFKDDDNETK
jgi:RND family efflux transporter MFP subunit